MDWYLFEEKFEAFIGVNLWTMLFAWINLIIIYLFLKKLLFGPVKGMIDKRQKEIDDMYQSAEEKETAAQEMKAEYEEKLSAAEEESEQILRNATRGAKLREEEILREANRQAERTLKRAEEEVELEKKRAINEVKNEVSDMALEIASAVIERDIKPDDHKDFIDDFIQSIGDDDQ